MHAQSPTANTRFVPFHLSFSISVSSSAFITLTETQFCSHYKYAVCEFLSLFSVNVKLRKRIYASPQCTVNVPTTTCLNFNSRVARCSGTQMKDSISNSFYIFFFLARSRVLTVHARSRESDTRSLARTHASSTLCIYFFYSISSTTRILSFFGLAPLRNFKHVCITCYCAMCISFATSQWRTSIGRIGRVRRP